MLLSLWTAEKGDKIERDNKKEKPTMAATMVETPPPQLITNIEWSMMDKSKFFPLYTLSSFTVRCALYPLTLVKTQIQIQRKKEAYSGIADAITKIYRNEGISGLYRGFWVSSILGLCVYWEHSCSPSKAPSCGGDVCRVTLFPQIWLRRVMAGTCVILVIGCCLRVAGLLLFQIISGIFYITTYEGVRHELGNYEVSPRLKSFIGGGCASIVGQTIIVPFDVLSQHLMVLGLVKGRATGGKTIVMNPLGLDLDKRMSKAALAREVFVRVYRTHGVRGYYRGYCASLAAYVPNSALWWALYTAYQDELVKIAPSYASHLLIQCIAGTLGGFTTTILTNPLDIVRARLQVEGVGTMKQVFKQLWSEEGLVGLYAKGLSARLVQSACFSFSIILGYESIKRVSISEEFRPMVRW